jgi:hypothetical protein
VVFAEISPPSVVDTLNPGESIEVDKTVDVPDVPAALDLFLIVDLSGSYEDDVPVIQGLAPDLFDDIRLVVPDSQFGLGSFVDFPISPWGDPGDVSAPGSAAQAAPLAPDADPDYAYRLDQDLTTVKATWLAAVNAMVALYGVDEPESQYEALYQAATGAGRDLPPGYELGEIVPGQDPTWRADATRVIAITTDASFHDGGENFMGYPFPYPGPTRDQTVDALNAAGIKVIGLDATGGGLAQLADVASATGGVVKTTDSSSSEIAEAILEAIEELEFEVWGEPGEECYPLDISLFPPSWVEVPAGETVEFEETIEVPGWVGPEDLPPDCRVECPVDFYADDVLIGTQKIRIDIPICEEPPPPPPPPPETPFVPEASTLLLLGSGITGLAGYAGLQWRARRKK